MKSITLAVMSDLHIGLGARAKDLCPHAEHRALDDNYRQRFLEFVKRKRLQADYLVVPGDVSDRAHAAELNLAGDVVSDVATALRVPADHCAFVPGNHDVDWTRLQDADPPDVRQHMKYFNLRNATVFANIMARSPQYLLDQPFHSIWQSDELIAVGYNSAWHDEQGQSPHHGLVAADHLQAMEEALAKLDLSAERLRLFIVHHHPVQYSDPLPDLPDFSAMTNAGNLMSMLHRFRFDLLVHGHKHKPSFETHSVNGAFPVAVLCAGSFSAQLDPRWSGYVNNQFHLVRVEDRDADSGVVRGIVQSWTYLCGHGWIPSQDNNGIRHRLAFGTYTLPDELARLIRPIIQERLQGRDFVEWSAIVARLPHLAHLPPGRVVEVLDVLAPELGYRRHGHNPEEIILLRLE